MSLPPIDWNNTRKRILPVAVFCFLALSAVLSGPAHGREIVDMAGRRVSVPDTITKVYGASPPVTYLIYAMDSGLIAGLNHPFTPQEATYLRPEVKNLPVIGGWFGQGRTPNQETLMQIKPDVMIVWTWGGSASNGKIEQMAKQLDFPLVYIRIDHLGDYAKAFRFMGTLLNREKRGRMLGDYTEKILKSVTAVVSNIPDSKRITVYYAEGVDGQSTECDQSPHAELIPMAGGKNIYRCTLRDGYGMEKISIEQVMLDDPEVILAQEKIFAKNVANVSRWQGIRAVRNKNIHLIPRLPFNWFDRPPSFMRILGIQWLTHSLYPDWYPMDVAAETKMFYKLFLGVELDDASVNKVLT